MAVRNPRCEAARRRGGRSAGDRIGDLSRVDESAPRGAVVEATDLLGGSGCDERPLRNRAPRATLASAREGRLAPRDRVAQGLPQANPPAPPQQFQEGQRREAGVLAAGRPAQSSEHEHRRWRWSTSRTSRGSSRPASASVLLTARSTGWSTNPTRSSRIVGMNRQAESRAHSILVASPPLRTIARTKPG